MKKLFQFALVAAIMVPSALVFNSCSKDDSDSGEVDPRLDQVVPREYRDKMEDYITIYDGVNPPNVEGVYLASPSTMVYDSDGDFEPGKIFTDYYYRFSNQNATNNTVDYVRVDKGLTSTESSTGAFISGNGNNFTIFFNTTGVSDGIRLKRALIVSGTMSDKGIKNMVWAFVITEKGSDPKNKKMSVGDFRVVKDGDRLAENSTWPSSTTRVPAFEGNTELLCDMSAGK